VLATAQVEESWAGLRPDTPDHLPIIGPTEIAGLLIATGHFRKRRSAGADYGQIDCGVYPGENSQRGLGEVQPDAISSGQRIRESFQRGPLMAFPCNAMFIQFKNFLFPSRRGRDRLRRASIAGSWSRA